MTKSAGHIAFLDGGKNEAFEVKGEVYIAPTDRPLATYGYRLGRWECSVGHWNRYYDAIFAKRVVQPVADDGADLSLEEVARESYAAGH